MSVVIDRFLKYIKVDTKSDSDSKTSPSTPGQFTLLRQLAEECKAIGLQDVSISEQGVVMATLPGNISDKAPVIGFIAHVDTSPDMSGTDIKPRLIEEYDGEDIVLNQAAGIVLSPREFPELLHYKGQPLLTTDGTTLLGADDKAGVAEIMTAMEYLLAHPEIKHGTIKVGFTPDEEIGRGVDNFDVAKFGAEFAYTVDGGGLGELEFENFNAAGVKVSIKGRNVHPGTAKDRMINASLIGMELVALLPAVQRPEHTEGYEGFTHLTRFNGTVEECSLGFIIRDHDMDKFNAKKAFMQKAVDFLNEKHGPGTVTVSISDSYFNMREQVLPAYHLIETAQEAMRKAGIEPKVIPVRGGTDGARLSFMGLPTPNLFAGGHAFHGKYEFVPTRSIEKAVDMIVNIAALYGEKAA